MSVEQTVQTTQSKVTGEIKNYIYDIIAAVIILTIIAASLNAIGFVDFSDGGFWDFFIEWLPYFMAAILLNDDLYKKGSYKGKLTTDYINIRKYYSNIVTNLTGEQIKKLYPFCEKYNEDALKSIQTEILKKEGLTYEDFNVKYIISNKDIKTEYSSLDKLTKKQMIDIGLNKNQIKAVLSAKKAKVKGLSVNQLLSSINIKDPTNIGENELELSNKYKFYSTMRYILTTAIMSLIAIKDITTWGWSAAIIVTFKVLYVFARCYMSYFHGYNDITIKLASHLGRKTDVLKMFVNDEEEFENLINNTSNSDNI